MNQLGDGTQATRDLLLRQEQAFSRTPIRNQALRETVTIAIRG